MQDLLDTINYMDKLMRAKSITTPPQKTSSPDLFSVPTNKSIIGALVKLGKGFEEIADFHRSERFFYFVKNSNFTNRNFDYYRKDVEARRQQIAIRCGKFHQDVLTAFRQGGMEEEMAHTILKYIPAKWIPSTNDDAVNAALEELSALAARKS
ncbi:hypothetical protein FDECE_11514 [Fusarium decemcellulare]|nr:hypothetical protein FDECE_11514 [Fusarium decemcellulare]